MAAAAKELTKPLYWAELGRGNPFEVTADSNSDWGMETVTNI